MAKEIITSPKKQELSVNSLTLGYYQQGKNELIYCSAVTWCLEIIVGFYFSVHSLVIIRILYFSMNSRIIAHLVSLIDSSELLHLAVSFYHCTFT